MKDKSSRKKIEEELAEALHNANHHTYMGDSKKAREFLAVADKCLEAIKTPKPTVSKIIKRSVGG